MLRILFSLLLACCLNATYAEHAILPAMTAPIPISDIKGYSAYPTVVQKILEIAFELSKMKLTYLYGSSDPKNKGMDCSGTIYFLLKSANVSNVPRQANEMFAWAEKSGKLYLVSSQDLHSSSYSHLKPGDLLFWKGTYAVRRNPDITHVMIYLGVDEKNEPLLFGASDGRTYQGKRMTGVSVFDFNISRDKGKTKFVGYSCVPDLTCD